MLVVLGSINVDGVMKTTRLPRPGETRLDGQYRIYPGGKGANQALAGARAGAQVAFVGCVGEDELAPSALAELQAAKLKLTEMTSTTKAATGYASVTVNEAGENTIIVASGANQYVRANQLPQAWLKPGTTVLLQGEIPMSENIKAAQLAKRRGARTLLNLAPYAIPSAELIEAIDILVLNEIEAEQFVADQGRRGELLTNIQALQRELSNNIILTLGAQGAIAFYGEECLEVPALAITPVDTTGAGDAFLGVFSAALDEDYPLATALRRGVIGGSLACLAFGAQSALPHKQDIDRIDAQGME